MHQYKEEILPFTFDEEKICLKSSNNQLLASKSELSIFSLGLRV